MAESPLKVYEAIDPELLKMFQSTNKFAYAEGALPIKYKYLTAMALDASAGAVGGVTNLAKSAMKAGATKEEVIETIRVAYSICGGAIVFTAARALQGVF